MIKGLQTRVSALYYYLEEQIDKESFIHISTETDLNRDTYRNMHGLLYRAKESSGVMYLYTAKPTKEGEYIYVVDGLHPESSDFRYPGDLIEIEIQDQMRQTLSGEIVMPDRIQETSWGYIFIAYLPIYNKGKVIGVLGIEFDAAHQYQTFRFLVIGVPLVIILFCIISFFSAFVLFRRISNPNYNDLSNTDMVTNLKNRNAFETDIFNLNLKEKSSISLLSIDLDNLKKINDEKGHTAGDLYIIASGKILQAVLTTSSRLYRTGGDEFVIIMHNGDVDTPEKLINRIELGLAEINLIPENNISLSIGFAHYNSTADKDLMDTFNRADSHMYLAKRKKKEQLLSA